MTRLAVMGRIIIFKDGAERLLLLTEITGFPNLKLFKHGKEIAEYPGQREVESLVSRSTLQTLCIENANFALNDDLREVCR